MAGELKAAKSQLHVVAGQMGQVNNQLIALAQIAHAAKETLKSVLHELGTPEANAILGQAEEVSNALHLALSKSGEVAKGARAIAGRIG